MQKENNVCPYCGTSYKLLTEHNLKGYEVDVVTSDGYVLRGYVEECEQDMNMNTFTDMQGITHHKMISTKRRLTIMEI